MGIRLGYIRCILDCNSSRLNIVDITSKSTTAMEFDYTLDTIYIKMETIAIISATGFSIIGFAIIYKVFCRNRVSNTREIMVKSPSMEELSSQETEDPVPIL